MLVIVLLQKKEIVSLYTLVIMNCLHYTCIHIDYYSEDKKCLLYTVLVSGISFHYNACLIINYYYYCVFDTCILNYVEIIWTIVCICASMFHTIL